MNPVSRLLPLLIAATFLLGQQFEPSADFAPAHGLDDAAGPTVPPTVEVNPNYVRDYVLGEGDVIEIWARDAEEISSRRYRVTNSGTVNLPMLGRVDVDGLTVEELEFHLELLLKEYIKDPETIVTVTEYRSTPAYVFGAVRRPGLTELRGPRSLVEVISMAGGLNGDASNTVLVTRRLEYGAIPVPWAEVDDDEQFSVAEIDLNSIIKGRSSVGNIVVRPFDLVVIPKLDAIYVTGEVRRPGTVTPFNGERVTALQAISMSGGLTEYAKSKNAKVLRPIMGGPDRYDIPINMKAVMDGEIRDFPLQPGDMLIVPGESRLKVRLMQSVIQSVIGSTINAAMWHVFWGPRNSVR